MSNIAWNQATWSDPEKWEKEWKGGYAWGRRELVERDFHRFVGPILPFDRKPRILEIACGMGRFTEQLLAVAEHVHSIDLVENCVNHCLKRFPERFSASVTDGKTLPEGVFDLIVSYDSLVHADYDVLSSYFRQGVERLVVGGYMAVHHANRPDFECSRMAVTGEMVADLIRDIPQYQLVSQCLFRYSKGRFVDCFTTVQRTK